MSQKKRLWSVYALLLLVALGFRLFIALRLPNDEPDDGRVYAQIAVNMLEQHVFSHESQPPYVPSIIRLPGYPLFLAGVYKIFGHGNNTAVRVVQALIDTLTCVLIALVAFAWAVADERRHRAAVVAFALAAVCPFTAIYVATVLTEVITNFLAVAMVLTVTWAFKSTELRRSLVWWGVSGLIVGLAVLFRPDSGLFAAAVGVTIVLWFGWRRDFKRLVLSGACLSLVFCLVLVPWTIRNYRVFHLFQPLSPAHGEMPGEFVPRGYLLWLRTWLDDERYISPVLWSLDAKPLKVSDFPDRAFDSPEERQRVAALLDQYNKGSSPPEDESEESDDSDNSDDSEQDQGGDEQQNQDDSGNEEQQPQQPQEVDVEMTPEIDAGFAQIGQERRARAPFRYYVVLPLKRAVTLWCDTHSQYYPFNGELLPLSDLDYDIHQQYWLPLFAALTAIYSLLGVAGAVLLWFWRATGARYHDARRWVLLAALLICLRLGFFATLENPEPRYTVELFPFLIILAGAGASFFKARSATSEIPLSASNPSDAVGGPVNT
jgi:4-amino-4-deoxy-L-arabinose transferase-like glycosyltransferase